MHRPIRRRRVLDKLRTSIRENNAGCPHIGRISGRRGECITGELRQLNPLRRRSCRDTLSGRGA